MSGISDKALKTPYAENKYRGNGGDELQNKEFSDGSGLEMYDANFRELDPQLGRFWQQDPLADANESWSLYSFVNDNPVSFSDPLGLADSTAKPKPPGADVPEMPVAIVTGKKKNCQTCDAPSVAAGIPKIDPTTNPLSPVPPETPPGKVVPLNEPTVEPLIGAGVAQVSILTAIFIFALPESAPGEGLHWKPYSGHGNNKDNTDPHIVYAFGFAPTDGKTPILKYGISDEARFGMDRPESQLAALRAKYGPTVMMSIYTRTINRAMALYIEQKLVSDHVAVWGEMPREQIRPFPFH